MASLGAALEALSDLARACLHRARDRQLKLRLVNVMTYGLLARHHLARLTDVRVAGHAHPHYLDLVKQLEDHLSAFTTAVTGSAEDTGKPPLLTLRSEWDRVCTKDEASQSAFLSSIFVLAQGSGRLEVLIEALERWETDVRRQFPEDQLDQITDDNSEARNIGGPSFAVRRAAQSVTEALLACKECSCLPEHHYGASLCLGTYQTPAANAQDGVNFDMFLSTSENWQEVRMHTIRAKGIHFDTEAEHRLRSRKGQSISESQRAPPVKIAKLCEPLYKVRMRKVPERLEFKVDKGQLYKLHSLKHTTTVDLSKSPVSLQQCLRGQPHAFTEKTKRVLAVVLSYSILHLHDTPWLQSTWDSSSIIFFHTASSQIPLKPYLQAQLSSMGGHMDVPVDGQRISDCAHGRETHIRADSPEEDGIFEHPCPVVVTLAMILLEIYFVQPFDELAARFGVDVDEQGSTWLHACDVFDRCKHEIPSDSRLLHAVDQCLNQDIWQDEAGNKLRSDQTAITIFDGIVVPLQTDLEKAFSYIPISELDQYIQNIDLSSWNQALWNEATPLSIPQSHIDTSKTNSDISLEVPSASPGSVCRDAEQCTQNLLTAELGLSGLETVSRTPSPLSQMVNPSVVVQSNEHNIHRFFDDESGPECQILESCQGYASWHSQYCGVYDKFISAQSAQILPTSRVKIAILDTGVDLNHFDIQANFDRIKARMDFVRGGSDRQSQNTSDLNGHGTFVTDLVLQYARDADIYVAKIADKRPSTPQIIAKAILHAVKVWKVDIISMSFGFPSRDIEGYSELERALKQAAYEDVLVFAAASNSGGRLGRAFPARERNVICVHSTDNLGNPSPFSPTAQGISLATVGEAVKAAWPSHLCPADAVEDTTHKSGTSFATPIMVGIAATLMLYARLNLSSVQAAALKQQQQMENLLCRVATKTPGAPLRGGYHFVDMSLYGDSLFGKEKAYIDATIEDVLRS
ncbi:uncharacterized protein B0I36DRAFT_293233 [Microdochium trichocladiopsis]|uniref:Peptidase S8/S53 domain-containing protein n=1 Tax=Microdochium trichocladiopsis TaxID=1682393 RepID=A0A9P9BMB0_9PEZI|nr:uncharacterized protein B0I36DRAFT_293233 [Microdochium trichocladiopsis]KAH7025646.1 hypothetical protein B0I36DRAFT_293233 [Microdochium trichocladiopsis]